MDWKQMFSAFLGSFIGMALAMWTHWFLWDKRNFREELKIHLAWINHLEDKTEELRSDLTDLQLKNHKGISRSGRVER